MTIQAPFLIQITDVFLQRLKGSGLMDHLRDICLKNCSITKNGLKHLNWSRLENINIIGASIDGIHYYSSTNTAGPVTDDIDQISFSPDLSFIPSNAAYKTLNWSIWNWYEYQVPIKCTIGNQLAIGNPRLSRWTRKYKSRLWRELNEMAFIAIFFPIFSTYLPTY